MHEKNYATSFGDRPDALIGVGAQLDLQNDRGWTALMLASNRGHTENAVALINAGAQLDLQDDFGEIVLTHASLLGHTEIAVALNQQLTHPGQQ